MGVHDLDRSQGIAAWAVLESLLLELTASGVLRPQQVKDLIEDAARAQEDCAGDGMTSATAAAAELIRDLGSSIHRLGL
ncbi:MAG TPA: hypothetical protein VMP03_09020 [Methylomirabilota bacterium]|nr:hypothetical protein [Methylomirabilota bacterium]